MTQHISREDAKAKGLPLFFTGVLCKHGHTAERYTSTGQCKACLSASNNARYQKNPQAFVDKSAKWRKQNPEKYAVSARRTRYKKQFGTTIEAIDALRESQNHQCPGCLSPLGPSSHIDHCHQSGAIRGVLCGPCNQAIGLVKEDVETLARLAAYLSANQT